MGISKTIHSKDYREIIARLKKARIEAGLRQEDVAHKLKKPQPYISKIESGERRLDVLELKQLIKIYKKSADYFIN